MSASQMPGVGDVIVNRYELVEELGKGGFGVVYRARQNRRPREVAVKLMHYADASVAGAMEAEEFKKRFRREAIMASNLNHPHAVQQFDFGEDSGLFYLAMELVRGETLKKRLEQQGPLPTELVARIGYATLDVLRLAHKKDIVHRDLKPENIMLCEVDGQQDFPKVLDFGAAKTMHGQHDLTQQGITLGSPSYMSPEVLMDEDPRPASDIYSLGLTLGEAIVGHKIVDGKTPIESLKQQISPHPLDLPTNFISHPLFSWLIKAIEKDPAERYGSADEMLSALEQLDIPGVDLSGDLFASQAAHATMAMSAISPDARPPSQDDFASEQTTLQDMDPVDNFDASDAGGDPATELIDLDGEIPGGSSLEDLFGSDGADDGEDATEMFELPEDFADGESDRIEMIDVADEFPDDGGAATEMIDRPADLMPDSSPTPSEDADESFHQAPTAALQAIDASAGPAAAAAGLPAIDANAGPPVEAPGADPTPEPRREKKSTEPPLSERSPMEVDANDYGGFSRRDKSAPPPETTEITAIKPTSDKDYMLVRTSNRRDSDSFMPIYIIGVVLLIIATIIVYSIAV